MKNIRIIESVKNAEKQFAERAGNIFEKDINETEMQLLMLYNDISYQEIKGFGGAFTEGAAQNYYKMNAENQAEIRSAYFSEGGLNYNYCRTHIGSCDFSSGNYNYVYEKDESLDSFSIDCDRELLLPFIKECFSAGNERVKLMSSPWSPPAWMKDNNQLLQGGKLLPEYYQLYAEYFVKYLKAYRAEGIQVDLVSTQNEPKAVQNWESCIFTAEEEKIFIRDFLYPALQGAGLPDVKIVIWDHNKERAFTRARHILSDEKANRAVYGIGFHWYSGDHFENLQLCKQFYPDKELIFTEGCVELSIGSPTNLGGNENVEVAQSPWEFGERYAWDMIGNINAGQSIWIDWNLLLNEKGGPNHRNNYCSAPIICDTVNQKVIYQPSYYFIGHFSKYIPAGSRRIALSKYTNKIAAAAFITPDQKTVAVILNPQMAPLELALKDVASDGITRIAVKAQSITTIIY